MRGLFLLSRAIGANRASHLAMTGEGLSADKALEYGIVYKLAEPEKLEKTVAQVIKTLARLSKLLCSNQTTDMGKSI